MKTVEKLKIKPTIRITSRKVIRTDLGEAYGKAGIKSLQKFFNQEVKFKKV